MTKLYVGNLPQDVSEKDIRHLFDSFGEVDEVAVFRDKGFAFVHFHKQEDADTAQDALDNSEFMGETILVQFSRTKGHGYGRGSGPPRPRGGRRGGPPSSYSRRDRPHDSHYGGDYRDHGDRDSFRERERGSRYSDALPSRDYGGRDYRGRDRDRNRSGDSYGDRYGGGRYEHDRGTYEKSSYNDIGGSKYAEYRGRSRSPGPRDTDRYSRDPYERSGYREEKKRW